MVLTEREIFIVSIMRRLMDDERFSEEFRRGVGFAVELIEAEAVIEIAQDEEALRWHGILDGEDPA